MHALLLSSHGLIITVWSMKRQSIVFFFKFRNLSMPIIIFVYTVMQKMCILLFKLFFSKRRRSRWTGLIFYSFFNFTIRTCTFWKYAIAGDARNQVPWCSPSDSILPTQQDYYSGTPGLWILLQVRISLFKNIYFFRLTASLSSRKVFSILSFCFRLGLSLL